MTVGDLYKDFVEQLKTIYDERESANITDWVFENIAGTKRLDRITDKQKPFNHSTIQQLNDALHQLLQHTPIQYVLNEAWFYKMKLKVNEHVLIPRPETEELVEWVVEEITNDKYKITNNKVEEPTNENLTAGQDASNYISRTHTQNINAFKSPPSGGFRGPYSILDIGTGSGCIAIALKKQLPGILVTAIDVSKDALLVAKQNAGDQDAEITFLNVDFLDEKSWPSLPSFSIIVSNPPYIPAAEKDKLEKNVTAHEPHLALFVEDDDPFVFYRKIADFAQHHLVEGGKIFVEVHEDYANQVQKLFEQKNFTSEIKKDIYGRERMVSACKM